MKAVTKEAKTEAKTEEAAANSRRCAAIARWRGVVIREKRNRGGEGRVMREKRNRGGERRMIRERRKWEELGDKG